MVEAMLLENQLSERTNLNFSHGICDSCIEDHFPDVLEAVSHGGVGGVEGGGVARRVGQRAHRRGGQLSPEKRLNQLCAFAIFCGWFAIVVFVIL